MEVLSEEQFRQTQSDSMRQLSPESAPPFDFFAYFDAIPVVDFVGYDSDGSVTYVYEDTKGRFQHVLFNTTDKNVFMVVVLDVLRRKVRGHRLLNLNSLYGLDEH